MPPAFLLQSFRCIAVGQRRSYDHRGSPARITDPADEFLHLVGVVDWLEGIRQRHVPVKDSALTDEITHHSWRFRVPFPVAWWDHLHPDNLPIRRLLRGAHRVQAHHPVLAVLSAFHCFKELSVVVLVGRSLPRLRYDEVHVLPSR